ncbi:hypothetical protein M011DRAFT_456951 [Sporormia fimetaria CBS 119925]|uniref:Uncharacterized protein n=1 Tax=Sporormia fimetaria CBS 119925 TaxID=1340428 RepID=A0A6A6VK46_9PLEO|nr:hypothetical protein M011DRAFT_456951 [Sporormia fimetaria CBS 119925]
MAPFWAAGVGVSPHVDGCVMCDGVSLLGDACVGEDAWVAMVDEVSPRPRLECNYFWGAAAAMLLPCSFPFWAQPYLPSSFHRTLLRSCQTANIANISLPLPPHRTLLSTHLRFFVSRDALNRHADLNGLQNGRHGSALALMLPTPCQPEPAASSHLWVFTPPPLPPVVDRLAAARPADALPSARLLGLEKAKNKPLRYALATGGPALRPPWMLTLQTIKPPLGTQQHFVAAHASPYAQTSRNALSARDGTTCQGYQEHHLGNWTAVGSASGASTSTNSMAPALGPACW